MTAVATLVRAWAINSRPSETSITRGLTNAATHLMRRSLEFPLPTHTLRGPLT